MNSADAHRDSAALVPGAHRVIRVLDAHEGPFAGALVGDRESVCVMTDADSLSGWAGWAHAGDEHIAGPVDVVRRRDGHDVLLPWCTERVSVFLGRREAVAEALSAGEVSTLVGSLLRGLDELASAPGGTEAGEWWLSDQGRPLFVIGAGDDARASAARLVDSLHRTSVDRTMLRLLAGIRDGLRKDAERPGVPPRQLHLWEAELLAVASPKPLRRNSHAPERARDIEMVRSLRAEPLGSRRSARAAARGGEENGPWSTMRHIIAGAGSSLRETGQSAVRRIRSAIPGADRARDARTGGAAGGGTRSNPGREGEVGGSARPGRRLVVAGAVAALILVGGLLWPGGATGEAPASGGAGAEPDVTIATKADAAESDEAVTASPTTPSRTPHAPAQDAPDAPSHGAAAEDPVQAASRLSASMRECAQSGDEECPTALAPGSTALRDILSSESVDAIGAEAEFSLVDEYGDVAVIRAAAATEAHDDEPLLSERLLVLVRGEDRWLVRDAYDVADQP
ncbi:hypothetical protein [uncultured Microbacterium sp.]|uniref:hypothetical protein n=1 Tax=uncultured Microbacterium sp. TaxID=191216 RepID=UPI0028D6DC87|nr:hypothetical protein [uncultured Microbacterium sp.]